MITDIIERWRNADIAIDTSPRYNGTPLALYIFLISLPYTSAREGGSPINAPMVTPMTVID